MSITINVTGLDTLAASISALAAAIEGQTITIPDAVQPAQDAAPAEDLAEDKPKKKAAKPTPEPAKADPVKPEPTPEPTTTVSLDAVKKATLAAFPRNTPAVAGLIRSYGVAKVTDMDPSMFGDYLVKLEAIDNA